MSSPLEQTFLMSLLQGFFIRLMQPHRRLHASLYEWVFFSFVSIISAL